MLLHPYHHLIPRALRPCLKWGLFALPLVLLSHCKPAEQTAAAEETGPPEDNRFTKVVLTQPGELDEPMEMTFLDGGRRVLFVERKGGVKLVDTETNRVKQVGTIPVNTIYTNKEGQTRPAEEGLMGVVAHPDFATNHWIYLYYADPDEPKHVLARWELRGDTLDQRTKKVVLEIPTQREECCHTGGGMVFDKEGNLFLTVGNNTVNPQSGSSNLDERPGHENSDDQRTAGNTNDLRGKILRIHPEPDGSYTIPEGNLFPVGTEKTRPEIYTMGHRNPWRPTLDSKTGYLYWGEVGPDASEDTEEWGPRGYDEFNQAREAGFFGWPYFIGDNKPYFDYDHANEQVGAPFDTAHVINDSPNNTGLRELPAPHKAFIWYPYGPSEEFPLVGSAGRNATGGPVFRQADFTNAARPFPRYFEGKWLIVDFMRGWIMAVTMDENGNYESMERFLPGESFSSAIDMDFSPTGDLYVLEYGSAWFRGNDNARLVRIEYNAGNRKPQVMASADKLAGALPLQIKLSSEGTKDYDKYDQGALTYQWQVTGPDGNATTYDEANPTVTFEQPGTYQAQLTVTDTKGEKNSQSLEVKAGNAPPQVTLDLTQGNQSFFFPNQPLTYAVQVSDQEDGSLADGSIQPPQVAVNFDYVPESFDPIEIAQNHRNAEEAAARFVAGTALMAQSDCKSCHQLDTRSIGPSYQEVAAKYKNDKNAPDYLANKVISGGSGVWGEHAMSAHPQLSNEDAHTMVRYILSLNDAQPQRLPLQGTYTPQVPEGESGKGGYLLRAAYTDKGAGQVPALTSEAVVVLRNPALVPEAADVKESTQLMITPGRAFYMVGDQSHLGYRQLDLTGVKQVMCRVQVSPRSGSLGGVIEVRLDAPDGTLIGKTDTLAPIQPQGWRQPPTEAVAPLEPTQGRHDVYFVFRNPEAKTDRFVMNVVELEFQNTDAPPAKGVASN
ncbi:cytochrome c [Catalinimonas alkaloidigena]|uniref:Cytochrome c n=1 Tax=Catalinimonas alkaloidigena TaxID=1075417 RepID=A0A1G9IMD6_9BACT|nr:PQQ-dependent sugar dehydrogenase [Catalinimonas alkaloidigena]SDL26300.1 cytochrome c [Catalinimonas alkaloidigena]